MPMSYRIDSDSETVIVVAEGVTTQAQRIQVVAGWLKDPAFRPGLDTFCDFSAGESTPTLTQLRELIALACQHAAAIGRSRVAILTSKPILFGVARVFEALAELEGTTLDVKVFFDRTLAWAWLRPGGHTSPGTSSEKSL